MENIYTIHLPLKAQELLQKKMEEENTRTRDTGYKGRLSLGNCRVAARVNSERL